MAEDEIGFAFDGRILRNGYCPAPIFPINLIPCLDLNSPDIGHNVAISVFARIREGCLWLESVIPKPNESSKLAEMTDEMAIRCVPVMTRGIAIALESFLGEK